MAEIRTGAIIIHVNRINGYYYFARFSQLMRFSQIYSSLTVSAIQIEFHVSFQHSRIIHQVLIRLVHLWNNKTTEHHNYTQDKRGQSATKLVHKLSIEAQSANLYPHLNYPLSKRKCIDAFNFLRCVFYGTAHTVWWIRHWICFQSRQYQSCNVAIKLHMDAWDLELYQLEVL